MNKIFLIILLFSQGYSCFAQEQKDTTVRNNSKQYFIGFQVGAGLGWRSYKNIDDAFVDINARPLKDEKPGLAYNLGINGGLVEKRWRFAVGFNYCYLKYYNNNASDFILIAPTPPSNTYDTIFRKYKYSFIHKFISIPIAFNYFLDNKKSWYVGGDLKFSWLIEYFRTFENSLETQNKIYLTSKYSVFWLGTMLGKEIIETKKININVNCEINYSLELADAPAYHENPYTSIQFESKPHNLLVPFINFNLQYKL